MHYQSRDAERNSGHLASVERAHMKLKSLTAHAADPKMGLEHALRYAREWIYMM